MIAAGELVRVVSVISAPQKPPVKRALFFTFPASKPRLGSRRPSGLFGHILARRTGGYWGCVFRSSTWEMVLAQSGLAHRRFGAGSMPALAMVAKFSWRSL